MVKRAKLLFVVVALLPAHRCHPMLTFLSRSATSQPQAVPPRASFYTKSDCQMLYKAVRRMPDEMKSRLTEEITKQMWDANKKGLTEQWPTHRNLVRSLVQETQNFHKDTLDRLLSIAVMQDDLALALTLLEKKANPNALNKQDLPIIVDAKTKRIAQTLLAHGEMRHSSLLPSGQTIFHHLVEPDYNYDLIPLYAIRNVPISHLDDWGQTPLHILTTIAKCTFTQMRAEQIARKVSLLLHHGANPDALNSVDCPPDEILRFSKPKPKSVQGRLFACILTLFDKHRNHSE